MYSENLSDNESRILMNYGRFIYFKTLIETTINVCSEWELNYRKQPIYVRLPIIITKNKRIADQELIQFLESVENEISFKIQEINNRQEGGFWPITKGDTNFINVMNQMFLTINSVTLQFLSGEQAHEELRKQKTFRHLKGSESDPPKSGVFKERMRVLKTQLDNPRELKKMINDLKGILNITERNHNPRIKALIMVQEMTVWPSVESVYEAFSEDSNTEVQLVYIPFEHVNKDKTRNEIEEYRERHLPIIHCKDYDLAEESPDLAFFVKPYDCIPAQFYIDNVDKVVTRSIYIPYFSNCLSYNKIDFHLDYHFHLPMHEKAWKIFDGPNYVRDFYKIYSSRKGENVEPYGHPRMDYLAKLDKFRMDIPQTWKEKIGTKKVFLWNTSRPFGSKGENEHGGATFEVFGEDLLTYFKQHEEIILLWRPHPFFFNGVIINKLMTDMEVDELKRSINDSKNIILDSNPDYRYAFSVADELISDSSSLLLDFLLLDKPIVYTCHEESYPMVNGSLLPAFHKATNWIDLEKFIKMAIKGEDPLKLERRKVITAIAPSQDKKIGERVKETCINDLEKEEKNLAKKNLRIK